MKKAIVFFTALFLMTLVAQNVNAQTGADDDQAETHATIITPISITKVLNLSFGNIVSGAALGTVTVDATGGRTSSGDVTLPTATPGNISAASFTVTGLAAATYSITLPTSFTVTNGSNTMTVNGFTSNPTATGVLTGGTQTLTVGATLNVNANQAAGSYSNTTALEVTVAYN